MKIRSKFLINIILVSIILISIFVIRSFLKEPEILMYNNDEVQEFFRGYDYGIRRPNSKEWKLENVYQVKKKYNRKDLGNVSLSFANEEHNLTYRCSELKVAEQAYRQGFLKEYTITNGEKKISIPWEVIELDNVTVYYLNAEKYLENSKEYSFTAYSWIIGKVIYNIDSNDYNISHLEILNIINGLK